MADQRLRSSLGALSAMQRQRPPDSGSSFYRRPPHLGVAAAKVVLTVLVVSALFVLTYMVQDWVRPECGSQEDHMACKRTRRAGTIVSAAMAFVRTVLVVVGALVALHHAGLRTTTLFALTSILSLVVGLAAQSMLRDLFTGTTLLAEEQMLNGDFVQILTCVSSTGAHGSGAGGSGGGLGLGGGGSGGGGGGGGNGGQVSVLSGIVEDVSLRRVKLRNFDNEVIYVPNSEIRAVINASQKYPVVRLRMSLSRSVDLDEALRVIQAAGAELAEDEQFVRFYPASSRPGAVGEPGKATERLVRSLEAAAMAGPEPELLGVSDVGAVGVEVMVRFMTDVGRQWAAGRYAREFYLSRLAALGPVTPIVRVLGGP